MVIIERDPDVEVTYVRLLDDASVAKTAEVTSAVNVDLDATGKVVGVEVLIPLGDLDDATKHTLVSRWPELREVFGSPGVAFAVIA